MKTNVHASCVAIRKKGVLLLGPSGAGKSDLALRLIDDGAMLVADDRTDLQVRSGKIIASAPAILAGLIEVRGLGIVKLPRRPEVRIVLAVRLGRAGARLPDGHVYALKGAEPVPLITMDGKEASAPAKIRLALSRSVKTGGAFTEPSK